MPPAYLRVVRAQTGRPRDSTTTRYYRSAVYDVQCNTDARICTGTPAAALEPAGFCNRVVFHRGFTPQRVTITLGVFFSHPGSSVSTERNKNTIKRFFDAFLNGRNQEMYAFLTNDAKWWINGKSGGPIAIQAWYDQITTMFSKARMPLDLEILSITAEDDRVSLEGRSRVYFDKINFLYENEYHFMFQLRDDHICSVREYLDTEYMAKIMPILAAA